LGDPEAEKVARKTCFIMSCNCPDFTCLDLKFNPCSTGAQLDITATENGTWTAEIEFNNVWSRFSVVVPSGSKVVIPTTYLNEFYTHRFKLYDTLGQLVNATCYVLRTMAIANGGSYSVIAPMMNADITVTEQGHSVTAGLLAGRTISSITTDGQSYNAPYFTKEPASDTITSNQLEFYPGQILTVYFK
jgi:hypothetical protein